MSTSGQFFPDLSWSPDGHQKLFWASTKFRVWIKANDFNGMVVEPGGVEPPTSCMPFGFLHICDFPSIALSLINSTL
jgi:hypothetical protein